MIGKVLGDRYQVIKQLGSGGMSVVYQAMDLSSMQFVALKVLKDHFLQDEDFYARFRREGEAVSRLTHPNIVQFYGVGEENGHPYIVMEYVEGETLKERIKREAPLKLTEALHIAEGICKALIYAHEQGIIHRDIKPHNVLLSKSGEVKVTDFGIARASSEATITHTGSVLGSVHYFSPEQARGGVVTEQSDIYSLGVVLYEMLTGELPFKGETPVTVALKHLQESYQQAHTINPEVPQSVENILTRALAKSPANRYSSARAMLADLETALQPDRVNEPLFTLDETGEATRLMPALNFSSAEEEQEQKRRKRHWVMPVFWSLTGLLVLILAGFAWQGMKDRWVVPDVVVPDVVGQPIEEAVAILEEVGLSYERLDVDDTRPFGEVVRQEPLPDLNVKKNRSVRLWVSNGPQQVEMPLLVNKTRQEAFAELQQLGFVHVVFQERYSNEQKEGVVLEQRPASSERVVPADTRVELVVSAGPYTFPMPNLVGLTLQEAEETLNRHDLVLGAVRTEASSRPEGVVIRQFPFEANQPVTAGSKVDVWVSKGMEQPVAAPYEHKVVVVVEQGEEAHVQVRLTDSLGEDREVVNEWVSRTTIYPVTLTLNPGESGRIQVLKNGQEIQSVEVQG